MRRSITRCGWKGCKCTYEFSGLSTPSGLPSNTKHSKTVLAAKASVSSATPATPIRFRLTSSQLITCRSRNRDANIPAPALPMLLSDRSKHSSTEQSEAFKAAHISATSGAPS